MRNTSLKLGTRLAVVFFAFGGASLLSACLVETADLDSLELNSEARGEEESVASTEQAVIWGWTPWVSEEDPPITCDGGSLMSSIQCSGRYCDNIRAYCRPTGGTLGGSYWTTYFSEEGTSSRYCNANHWVTGISCTGRYCDNISLQCSYIGNKTPRYCYWTGWVSEEGGGTLSFGSGYYARGAQCFGSYCDNKRFYVCQAG